MSALEDTAREASVNIVVDGMEVVASRDQLLIDACEAVGIYIPRFCYHPRLKPVGMCRMCLVEVDTGRGPALQPSCMISCAPDMVVSTESEATKKAQDGVLEFLLINHPLDCPICDKGGECPLQDQTMAYGPGESRFVEEKRHFEKPIPISETVYLDRERCILCDRCTRFAKDVAGDPLIHFIDRGSQTEVNTFPDEPFSSYFSGNTVQLCPVGALTAKPYRFKARPWDLEELTSTLPNPTGDRVNIQTSRNEVLRIQGVDSDAVNWGWLTDKDRFCFEAIGHPDRLSQPMMRGRADGTLDPTGDELIPTSWSQALGATAEALRGAIERGGTAAVGFIGGARLTNEDQYAWVKLAKGVLGTDNVDAQIGDGLPAELVVGLPRTTIDDACRPGGAVILVGVDPKEDHGTLYLRLRHAVLENGLPVIELNPRGTGLSPIAAAKLHARPGDEGAVARALVVGAVPDSVGGVAQDAIEAASALLRDRHVTVIFGRGSLAHQPGPVVDAVAALAALPSVSFLPALRRGNVHGALDLGMAPGFLPGRVTLDAGRSWYASAWDQVPLVRGRGTAEMLTAAADGRLETLVLLGADPLGDYPDRAAVASAFDKVGNLIAVDQFVNDSTVEADIVFPAAGFAECSGTHTNIEGRITPLRQAVTPPGTARSDWMIAAELAIELGADLGFDSVEAIWAEIEELCPAHAGATRELIEARDDGLVIPLPDEPPDEPDDDAPTDVTGSAGSEAESGVDDDAAGPQDVVVEDDGYVEVEMPPLASFRAPEPSPSIPPDGYALRLVARRRLYDEGTLLEHCPSMAGLAERARVELNPYDLDRLGVGEGGDARLVAKAGRLVLPAVADPAVPRGVASVTFRSPGADVGTIIDATDLVTDVRVETP